MAALTGIIEGMTPIADAINNEELTEFVDDQNTNVLDKLCKNQDLFQGSEMAVVKLKYAKVSLENC